jgi:hypothetical protein
MHAGFFIADPVLQGEISPARVPTVGVELTGGGPPASRAALPCLLSHNSDSHREKVSGNDRKRAERTRQNIGHVVSGFGERAGVLTITFAKDLTTKEAQKKRGNFMRRVGREIFGEFVSIREFTLRGRPHFHMVVDCLGDVTTGFDWEHHDRVTAWSKAGRKGAKPYGSLNRTPLLAELHRVLREKAPKYGLGEIIELVPVRKAEAVGFYLGGYLSKSLANKPADAKGTRAVNYSRGCPQIMPAAWSWANESAWLWRAKLRTWAHSHGCVTMLEVRALFGEKWAYHHREAILATPLSYYPTAEHARRDGVWCPPDSVEITNTITRTGSPGASRAPARVPPERLCAEQPPEVLRLPYTQAVAAGRSYSLHSREALARRLNYSLRTFQRSLRLEPFVNISSL